jgi:hypothetical protein
MNRQRETRNLQNSIRVGLVAAIAVATGIVGLGIVGFSGTAGASGPTCSSALSVSTVGTYTYETPSDQILALSGSGCSQGSKAVTISITVTTPADNTPQTLWTTKVTPKKVKGTKKDYAFSFTDSNVANQTVSGISGGSGLYLTQAAANAASPEGHGFPVVINYNGRQRAHGVLNTSTVGFTYYTANPEIP